MKPLCLALVTTTTCVLLSARAVLAQDQIAQAKSAFQNDVHFEAGLTCASCHAAVARPGSVSEFTAPKRTEIAPLCAKCHSDAAYAPAFAPQVRVDRLALYGTSAHGKRMAAGDDRAATCSDCHGAHGIPRLADARSPVAPQNAARTCASCHSDAAKMAPFGHSATEFTDWSSSVHAAALTRGDTSAPTCYTCHGSHGANRPGVMEVANVCGNCHVREAELFRASPKKKIFDSIGQPDCLACHSNHRIEPPSDAWVGLDKEAVCATCHDASMAGSKAILEVRQGLDSLVRDIGTAREVVSRAERAGMLVDEGSAALLESQEHLIHSRVLVHSFVDKSLADTVASGRDSARRARQAGEQALEELEFRRRGLALATLLILGFLVTLWLKIRSLPPVA